MMKILVIDDDFENREILKARLEAAGYAVELARDGEEGLRLCRTYKPNLVFLDLMMPKMDGWQVCKNLKADAILGTIPVIMLTACHQQIDQLRGWESGADAYLTKPWEAPKLLEAAQNCLAKSTATAKQGNPPS
jgi:adenylate cyclase